VWKPMHTPLWLLLMLCTACASRTEPRHETAARAEADRWLRDGCYQCLEAALERYGAIAAEPDAPASLQRHAFDAAILLAVRAKELGIPSGPFLEHARARAAAVRSSTPRAPPAAIYLAAVEIIVGETSGWVPEARYAAQRRLVAASAPDAERLAGVRGALEKARAEHLVAEYLALAIDCERPAARATVDPAAVRARHTSLPLLEFRLALCGLSPDGLSSLRVRDPRWVDTQMAEGRSAMSARPVADLATAADHFAAARRAFPQSAAAALALGTVQNAIGEADAALASFDAVLAGEPDHEDALLGRLMSLSHLKRHTEAVASARRLIERGTWHVGDAHYWRAWNRYHLYALESAWSDVEAARRLLMNSSVHTLAGFIAYARKELDLAIERFEQAVAMDRTNCDARWTAALVRVDQQAWSAAAASFSEATGCFGSAAAELRAQIRDMELAIHDPAAATRLRRVAQNELETSEHRQAQAAFNAAENYVRVGRTTPAIEHLSIAAEHPLLRQKARALRAVIEKAP
jgi:tetratricopeptide (TPR) repeat protein